MKNPVWNKNKVVSSSQLRRFAQHSCVTVLLWGEVGFEDPDTRMSNFRLFCHELQNLNHTICTIVSG